ncbi:hypothetical protein ERO13_A09G012950v2 [Gossypium hirsutum]|nr:hypothetical protein ERO13_A09G012950v2 [Gossypium hirsutum]
MVEKGRKENFSSLLLHCRGLNSRGIPIIWLQTKTIQDSLGLKQ